MRELSGIKDPVFVRARQLRKTDAKDLFLIEGEELLAEAIANHFPIEEILLTENLENDELYLPYSRFLVSHGMMKKLYPTGKPPQIVAIAKKSECALSEFQNDAIILVLDHIQNAGNIGTIIRTAEAFGLGGLLIIGDSDLYGRSSIRGTQGAFFRLKICHTTNEALITFCKTHHIAITSTTPHGTLSFETLPRTEAIALIVGNETSGVNPTLLEHASHLISLPMKGKMESLNVGVFTGVALYALTRP